MNRLGIERRTQIISALVDGNSIRATCRLTDTAKATVLKLLVDVGGACKRYHDEHVRNLTIQRVQVDEIWSFCYAKQKNVSPAMAGIVGAGDAWTFVAIDSESKLVPAYRVGQRTTAEATIFMRDLVSRLTNRVQLTTDGHNMYLAAVETAFGWNGVDYAVLDKVYARTAEGTRRYSPPVCVGAERKWVMGNPDRRHVSTSHVERGNLTLRMSQRRFTRLTNAFSKKLANLKHAVALRFLHYNLARQHQTLRVSPAMAAGIEKHLWTVREIVEMADQMPRPQTDPLPDTERS